MGLWYISTLTKDHNHGPASDIIMSYHNRNKDLSTDMKEFICSLSNVGIAPEDVLSCFRRKFENAPLITAKDIANLRTPIGGGSTDAYHLLEKLQQLQAQDDQCFLRWKVDAMTKKLTHLFWMSSRQRELARDLFQVLIHDNTYKTNRFNLPAGLFSAPNRHGQTMLLAVSLASKETTSDYEWQYQMWMDAVGISPGIIFTDADPGATAAISNVLPLALHLWCLWHIHQNLRKNLGVLLGKEYQTFLSDFIRCQQQTSEIVFWSEYNKLKETWKKSASYLDEQLTPNVVYWAGFSHTRFSTGAVSTQRGEGLNRHFKAHLSGQSPLSKLFNEVLLREERETAKLIISTVKDNIHTTKAMSYAQSCYPDIIKEMETELTAYGLSMFLKQVAAGANYIAYDVEDLDAVEEPDVRAFSNVDADVLDLPRMKTASHLLRALPTKHQQHAKIYKLVLLHTITNKPTNPQFVILFSKLEGRQAYKDHVCTCGCGVRSGVPCRHFWAVLRSTTTATFHQGLVNDLWFKHAQSITEETIMLHTYDDPKKSVLCVPFVRQIYALPDLVSDDMHIQATEELSKDISLKRIWGTLLGEAKKAIERAIKTNNQDGLYVTLQGFSNARENTTLEGAYPIGNPGVVKGKGRPRNSYAQQPRTLIARDSRDSFKNMTKDSVYAALEDEEPPAKHPKTNKKRVCKNCGGEGHDSRNCP